MTIAVTSGGIPYVLRETFDVTGRKVNLKIGSKWLCIRVSSSPCVIYFSQEDFDNDENGIGIGVPSATNPYGEWKGSVSSNYIWIKGWITDTDVELVCSSSTPDWYMEEGGSSGFNPYAVPTATITHTKNGTFSIIFSGTNGAVIYCDPGDGSAVQEKTLLGISTNVTFSYANDGTERTVLVTGDIGEITSFTSTETNIQSNLLGIVRYLVKLKVIDLHGSFTDKNLNGDIDVLRYCPELVTIILYYNSLTGDITNAISGLTSMQYFSVGGGDYTCSSGTWNCTAVTLISLTDGIADQDDVGRVLINAAGVQTGGYLYLAGTNPAPPATPEVAAAIAELAGDGVTVYTS